MEIPRIGNYEVILGLSQGAKIPDAAPQQGKGTPPQAADGQEVSFSRLTGTMRAAQEINAGRNAVAGAIRTADSTLAQANIYVEKMKAQLDRIVKLFPPFPPGDPQRVEYLRNFSGIRQIINELTIPPSYDELTIVARDTSGSPAAGTGVATATADALGIPDLPDTATDQEVGSAVATLDAAQARIAERRQALARDAGQAAGSIGGQNQDVPATGPDAEKRSADVRAELVSQPGQLTAAAKSILEIM